MGKPKFSDQKLAHAEIREWIKTKSKAVNNIVRLIRQACRN